MNLKIGHLGFEVRRPTGPEAAENPKTHGVCYPSRGVILLFSGYSPQEEAATLMHEALHAMWWANKVGDIELKQEDVCTFFEGPLVQFMHDNPHAVSAIIAAAQGVPMEIPG